MFRRIISDEIGGYSVRFEHAEDVDFCLRFGEKARLANLPDLLLRYRQHAKSVGYRQAEAQAQSHFRAISEAAIRMNAPAPAPIQGFAHGTVHEIELRWGWWALGQGYPATARHYARKIVRRRPLAKESWKFLACAIRGR